MHRQHYRARDKTVRKMGRDGLMEENLRSGESVRVSKRETDHLTLPKTADDSMNFQDRRSHRTEDKKTGGKQRSGYSPDFKRPASEGTDNIQADYYQTDAGKADSYRETDNYGENVQGTFPDRENIPETDTGGRVSQAGSGFIFLPFFRGKEKVYPGTAGGTLPREWD